MIQTARLTPAVSALLEVCILFLPAIPAYLWLWPNLDGDLNQIAQIITYLYVLAGTLFIGLRRWTFAALGINQQGMVVSLVFGLVVILGRSLVVLSLTWDLPLPVFRPAELIGNFIFYFAVVGVVEELLFRGLVYRAFEDWLGARWAIWGSSVGFVLWHIFDGGPLVGAAMLLYGLIFALMRWRAGGILGLILVHGAMDFVSTLITPDIDVLSLGRPEMLYPALMLLGLAIILLTPVILWKLNWLLNRFSFRRGVLR